MGEYLTFQLVPEDNNKQPFHVILIVTGVKILKELVDLIEQIM